MCSPKGLTPATLDDIAQTAGYTKGAIYKHFATKADLFLPLATGTGGAISTTSPMSCRRRSRSASRTRRDRRAVAPTSRDRGAEHAALGHEFTSTWCANPDARERVAAKRSEVVEALAKFIVEGIDRLRRNLDDSAVDVRPDLDLH